MPVHLDDNGKNKFEKSISMLLALEEKRVGGVVGGVGEAAALARWGVVPVGGNGVDMSSINSVPMQLFEQVGYRRMSNEVSVSYHCSWEQLLPYSSMTVHDASSFLLLLLFAVVVGVPVVVAALPPPTSSFARFSIVAGILFATNDSHTSIKEGVTGCKRGLFPIFNTCKQGKHSTRLIGKAVKELFSTFNAVMDIKSHDQRSMPKLVDVIRCDVKLHNRSGKVLIPCPLKSNTVSYRGFPFIRTLIKLTMVRLNNPWGNVLILLFWISNVCNVFQVVREFGKNVNVFKAPLFATTLSIKWYWHCKYGTNGL